MDCGEQTKYMNKKLVEQASKSDDNWNFLEVSGLRHAWRIAVSSNPNDPVIYYDTRGNDVSVGSPCDNCHGFSPTFGFYNDLRGSYDGLSNGDSIDNPNTILPSYHPKGKQ